MDYKKTVRKYSVLGCVAVMFLSMWACMRQQKQTDHSQAVAPNEITAPFDSLFAGLFDSDKDEEPGAIIIVMRSDSIVYRHAYGFADLEKRMHISDTTVFNLSSASKIFTTVALMKLAEEKVINLDDPVIKYIPELPHKIFDSITLRHILTHTSGLPDIRPRDEKQWSSYIKQHKSIFGLGNDYRLYGSDKEHMQVFLNLDSVDHKPGTFFQWNDPAYIMIAPMIEKVTGQNFDSWMKENIFEPSGMMSAFYMEPDKTVPNMAHGYHLAGDNVDLDVYRSDNGKWEEYDYGEAEFFLTKADRGVYATPRDLVKWKNSIYKGKIISDSSLLATCVPYVSTGIRDAVFGLGTAVRVCDGEPTKKYHLNSNGGFSVVEGSWPSADIHYMVIANRNDWDITNTTIKIDSIIHSKGWLKVVK
ncbi:MAG: beta-lactamase family protein [Muribaculum sp.]|nr:beta-lactamase family protein [Muribaculaceae bacterium]MCM1080268.1 beta-lactamase family protein [Muribaculum sp.]